MIQPMIGLGSDKNGTLSMFAHTQGKRWKQRLKHSKYEFPNLFIKTKANICSLSIRINRKTCSHCSYPSGQRFWRPASQDSHRPHLSRLDPAPIINLFTLLKKQMWKNFKKFCPLNQKSSGLIDFHLPPSDRWHPQYCTSQPWILHLSKVFIEGEYKI